MAYGNISDLNIYGWNQGSVLRSANLLRVGASVSGDLNGWFVMEQNAVSRKAG